MNVFKSKYFIGFAIILMVLVIFTTIKVGAGSTLVYVDADYSGEEEGSSDKPFSKIQDAVDKAADKNQDVYVREGDYKENIKLLEDVKLYGSDKNEVIIKAEDDDEPVVKMYDDSEISEVTLKDGQYGILVNDESKALIQNCIIIDNEDDGIFIQEAETDNDEIVEIYDSFIAHNGWNGIYSEERKFSIKRNEIYNNDGDGVEFADDSEGVFEDNLIKKNDGVGLRVFIDESELYIKDNTFRENNKSGIEVGAGGQLGEINLDRKNKFYKNGNYGIVRVERAPFSFDQWNKSFVIEHGVIFWDNVDSEISHFIRVY
jgi:hypothetical protein